MIPRKPYSRDEKFSAFSRIPFSPILSPSLPLPPVMLRPKMDRMKFVVFLHKVRHHITSDYVRLLFRQGKIDKTGSNE